MTRACTSTRSRASCSARQLIAVASMPSEISSANTISRAFGHFCSSARQASSKNWAAANTMRTFSLQMPRVGRYS